MSIRTMVLVSSLAILVGCSSPPKPTIVTNIKTIYKPLPDTLLRKCPIPKPISKEEYLAKDVVEREIWLTNYNVSLMKELGKCNIQINNIKSLNDSYMSIYKE